MVHSINSNNKEVALEILYNSFLQNKNLVWMVRANKLQSIRNLCSYCLEVAIIKKGAFITKDKKGVVLAYQQKTETTWLMKIRLWFLYLKLIITTIDVRKIASIFTFNKYVEQFRPKENYLYCIMLGIQGKEKKVQTLFGIRDFLFELSEKYQLELHMQTSTEKVMRIFEKRGFQRYQTIFNPIGRYKLWLLKKAS